MQAEKAVYRSRKKMIRLPYISYKENGIPILSQKQINHIAEGIVRDLMPQNFEKQVDATNLKVFFKAMDGWNYAGKYLSRSGYLMGLTSFQGGEILVTDFNRLSTRTFRMPPNTILVEKGLYAPCFEHMFRFTFAHEVGHALLHRRFCEKPDNMKAYAEQGSIKAIQDTQERFRRTDTNRLQTERDWLEWQANAFASAVLMPETLFRRVGELVLGDKAHDLQLLNELLVTVSDTFRVSLTASWFRLKELGYIPPQMRFHKGMITV